ncbi:MAG: EamA family transporter, partial [Burkholderiales bacterium]
LVVVPWHLWSASGALWRIAPSALLWQVLWQGVLIGCVALVALNHAIGRLGPERASALVALVPALTAVLGLLFLREVPSSAEIAAVLVISAGVSIGASRGYGGSPAASNASAKPVA